MGRKRSFESLEERRLLANVGDALASAAPARPMVDASSALPAAADVSAASPSSSAAPSPASAGNTGDNSGATSPATTSQNPSSSSDVTSAESPNEYASPSGNAASNSSAAQNPYGTYANEYTSSRTYSYGPNYSAPYYTPAQTAAITSLAAALEEQTLAGQTSSPIQQFAPVASVTSGSSPSGGAATGGSVSFKPSDLVVRSESQPPLAVARPVPAFKQQPDELAHPIALLSPRGHEIAFSQAEPATTALEDDGEAEPRPATPLFAGPLAGPIAGNLELIERGVDALFERLERWGVEWASGAGPRRLGQALVAAAGAAAAWEYARARYREAEAGRMPYDWRAPRELHLPRRQPVRRRGTQ